MLVATQIVDQITFNANYLIDEEVRSELIQVVSISPIDLAKKVGIQAHYSS